ncbi:yjeF C-terminal region, hydroxyethylthiazole kinase-related [Carnobacterium iners]|uniref:ADP-dependent (S)-NAD(P)H-hydrate dehydratase n=1 Tax=Carnobacterium iners TaxID=1073423 RepID=A0A1X7MNB6_9LACT|nr:NAD(P)H-hydrate dehydratase [Carnobacterium iners]SEL24828.1 yjeF C-terminal region, hydroxyethylthiazole kinase-related [Carnobacterium iners]SMH26332.1 yjeF C-terminal region, hydroxyethylthiazole kinase-related [Carnobacterium iners]
MKKLDKATVQSIVPKRKNTSYKGDYGKVLLIGGNESMGGAIILTALAAVYSGAGLVTVATAKRNHISLHAQLPEAMVIDWDDYRQLENQLKEATVIAIGPGMGTSDHSLHLLCFILAEITKEQRVLIDGSAITLMAKHDLAVPNDQTIFTPHLGEWERLSGLEPAKQNPILNQVKQKQLHATIVLKQHRTEIYFEEDSWQNQGGNPAMATGGMGDTLAGIVASLIAQLPDLKSGVLAGVFLHSYIGDQLAQKQYVVLPSQLIKQLPVTLKDFSII